MTLIDLGRKLNEDQPVSTHREAGNTTFAYTIDTKPSLLNKICMNQPIP